MPQTRYMTYLLNSHKRPLTKLFCWFCRVLMLFCRELILFSLCCFCCSFDAVDANYLFSSLCLEYAPESSTRREVEEYMMDFLQDFLFHLEDDPNVKTLILTPALKQCRMPSHRRKLNLQTKKCMNTVFSSWMKMQNCRTITSRNMVLSRKLSSWKIDFLMPSANFPKKSCSSY